jgi:hypothetical protein
MGGSGSGRYSGRPTVDGSARIELPRLKRSGFLKPGSRVSGAWSWSRGDEPWGSVSLTVWVGFEGRGRLSLDYVVDGLPVEQQIELEGVPMRFGGHRWYARCPASGRRCTTLVLPNGGRRFASVKAWRLAYASQNEDIYGRAHRRIAKAEARLARMSKYARKPTRDKQWARLEHGERVLDFGLTRALARIMKWDARVAGRKRRRRT